MSAAALSDFYQICSYSAFSAFRFVIIDDKRAIRVRALIVTGHKLSNSMAAPLTDGKIVT